MNHFGTDGIRMKADVFTEEYLRRIAVGIAGLKGARFVIGRDPRVSGIFIERTLTKYLVSFGAEVLSAGMIPTPTLAYLTKLNGADYGIMLSASHNPPEYNGIKLFNGAGEKISEAEETKIEEGIEDGSEPPEGKGIYRAIFGDNDYVQYLLDVTGADLSGMKILLDTANGATANIAPVLFARAGAEVQARKTETDGIRINEGCGATVPKYLMSEMEQERYDIGFTFDGDGDRLMCVAGGKLLNGDHLMYVHCKERMKEGKLFGNAMVGTIMSNLGTERACKKAGINLIRTGVGDKYVFREMVKSGYVIGGEESGHIIFSEYMKTGDGMLAALLTAMLHQKAPVQLSDDIVECPSVSDAVLCDKTGMERFRSSAEIKEYLESISEEYRIVVRPSGTEPKIRILVEAEREADAKAKAQEIKSFIQERVL